MSSEIVFVAAKRTPFGTFGGTLASLSATDLGTIAAKAALQSGNIDPSKIEHVVFGNVLQTSSDAAYLARHIGLRCEIPVPVPAVTINRLCGSGFEAICQGVRLIRNGEAGTVLVGGTENMSQAPYVLRGARFGYRMNNGELEDSLVSGLHDAYANIAMSGTAELLAEENDISREMCDTYALRSQKEAHRATEAGVFKDEIEPVTVRVRRKEVVFAHDEHVRADASLDKMAKLKPVFKKDGVITAANASGICDGAAALVITTEELAKKNGWNILGKYIDAHVVGVDPKRMGIGPVDAIQGLVKRNALSLSDLDYVEVNEAFASQLLSVEKVLGLEREKLNVNGGAIALGHPLAASGARIITHLLHFLAQTDKRTAIGSACIGGGQGQAILIRR